MSGIKRHHRRAPDCHAQDERAGAGNKERQDSRHWDQAKGHCPDRGSDQDEGHAPSDLRPQAVGPGTHGRLDEQRCDVIQCHEETDPDRGKMKFVCQE